MKYSPKHNDTAIRVVYGFLIVCGFIMMSVGEGLLKTVLSSLSLVFLATGLYLFIRFDMTTFTYILMENEKRIDFYVDRTVGRRGSYVCYFPLYDCIELSDFNRERKKELKEKYEKIVFYNYCHNKFAGDKQALIFNVDGCYEAIIVELGKTELDCFKRALESSKRTSED